MNAVERMKFVELEAIAKAIDIGHVGSVVKAYDEFFVGKYGSWEEAFEEIYGGEEVTWDENYDKGGCDYFELGGMIYLFAWV